MFATTTTEMRRTIKEQMDWIHSDSF